MLCASITDLERRTILWPRPAVIIDPRRRDVGMPKPLLHLGDVGLVIERIGGGGRAQRMRADLEAERGRIGAHQPEMPSGVIAPSSLPVLLLRIGRNSAPASSLPWPAASRYSWMRAWVPGCSGR